MDEIFVDIELIDEIVVDALQDDEVSVTIEDADEIEVEAFDYPPEVDQLNSRVAACEENSQNAIGLANAALGTATESAVLAATANETANNAGTLASQAAQSALQAEGIAEGAATTAGEAAQAINEHAQAITNPHPANTVQNFAEVGITGLKSDANGGAISAADYNWFKGVYASLVDGSVISWIMGLVNRLKDAVTRISALENNLILSITLTETVASLNINLPTPEYDIEVEVDYTANVDVASNAVITVNDITGNNYVSSSSQTYLGFISYVGRYASVGTYRFQVINNKIFCVTSIQQIWGNISTKTPAYRTMVGYLKTSQTSISKITIGHPINAGSVIKVRRIKRHA